VNGGGPSYAAGIQLAGRGSGHLFRPIPASNNAAAGPARTGACTVRASERAIAGRRTTNDYESPTPCARRSSRLAVAAMSELLGKFFGKDKDGKQGGKARDKSPAVGEPGAGTSAAAQANSGAADFCTYRRSLLFILIY